MLTHVKNHLAEDISQVITRGHHNVCIYIHTHVYVIDM